MYTVQYTVYTAQVLHKCITIFNTVHYNPVTLANSGMNQGHNVIHLLVPEQLIETFKLNGCVC